MAKMTLLGSTTFTVIAMSLSLLTLPAVSQDAATTYKSKCAMCHGADGKGDTPAGKKMGAHDFASDEVQKQSDSDLTRIISKGKNKMPAYEGKLKSEEIKDLLSYVRKLGQSH